jgi:hypothetical protein
MLNYLNLIHDFHSHMLSMNHVNLVLAMTHLALSSHHSSWVHTLFYFMCIASLESGHLLSQCSFYAILFSDLVFVDWNCFQVGPQFVLDFSEFDSFCSSCSNNRRLSRNYFTLFFHWRPMLRMDDSSNSMHTRSLCNGVNNFYFFFNCLFIFLLSWVLFSFAIL